MSSACPRWDDRQRLPRCPLRCRGGDSPARLRTCSPYRLPSKWQTPPICHCEESAGRRGALSAQREEVPLGCNLGKAVTFSPGLSCYPTGYCEIATAPLGPRNDNSGVHTILLLAMTRQESARCTSALLRLNHPRTRRSGSAATGWLWVPAILMAARSKRRCGPAKDESYIFSKNGLFSQSLHNQIAPLGGQHICQPCHLHQPHNTHSP